MPPADRRTFSFPKSARLLRRGEFVAVKQRGRGFADGPLAASWAPRLARAAGGRSGAGGSRLRDPGHRRRAARLGAPRRAAHRGGSGAPPMSAAPTLHPDPSSSPEGRRPARECGAGPSTGGTAVFHVERLPLRGWGLGSSRGLESLPGRWRAGVVVAGLARAAPGGPTPAAGSAQPIPLSPDVTPARAAPGAGESARCGPEVRLSNERAGGVGSGWAGIFAWPL